MNEEVKAVLFKNFSDEEFTCSWNKVPYKFKPGQEMYVEDWKGEHFAKHLIDREINKVGGLTNDKVRRSALIKLALPDEMNDVSVDEIIDTNAREEIASRKKDSKITKITDEPEFAELTKE